MYRYIVIDGPDAVGKTTLLNGLKQHFISNNIPVHMTKGLGGDGTDEFQNYLRKVLLHSKFPKDNVYLEETLFALADLEGTKIANEFLIKNPNGIVLKDRGAASHLAYASMRGFKDSEILAVHGSNFEIEEILVKEQGGVNIVMVPTNIDFTLSRLRDRAQTTGEQIVERLENFESQAHVLNTMSNIKNSAFMKKLNVKTLDISPTITPNEVLTKALAILR